jgi:hypothetical protein
MVRVALDTGDGVLQEDVRELLGACKLGGHCSVRVCTRLVAIAARAPPCTPISAAALEPLLYASVPARLHMPPSATKTYQQPSTQLTPRPL